MISGSILNNKIKPNILVEKMNETDIDYIHLDIMDGKFVKNKTWTTSEIKKILKNNKKKLDVHLMVNNPTKYIDEYSLLNIEYITFHYEAVKNPLEIINHIKNYGFKAGMSIKPNTKAGEIIELLQYLDLILIMSVEPGKSGQKFIPASIDKIKELRKELNKINKSAIIEVDGGVNNENTPLLREAGADILVSASYLHEGDMQAKIRTLR